MCKMIKADNEDSGSDDNVHMIVVALEKEKVGTGLCSLLVCLPSTTSNDVSPLPYLIKVCHLLDHLALNKLLHQL